jgi:hypothetical protein
MGSAKTRSVKRLRTRGDSKEAFVERDRLAPGATAASIRMSDYGFPTFRCTRPVTTEDVNALDSEK